jgi:hypothetical protein
MPRRSRKPRREEFTVILTMEDEVRVRFDKEGPKIVDFSVQYLARIRDQWRPIVRFDTAHGRPHMDISYPDGTQETRDLHFYNYNVALTYAIKNIQDRWKFYRERYERELP